MRLLALWLGKTIFNLSKLSGRRGSALPGYLIEKIYPSFLEKSLKKLPQGVIIVTGTNGKTTSTKMLAHILKSKYRVLTNPTGSNFVRGITSTVIQHMSFWGKLNYDIAVIELDEAYAVRFVNKVNPRGVVVLNVMRDQMDRFGEIDHTAKLINKVVKKATEFVVLNRDDIRVVNMDSGVKSKVYYFGVSPKLRGLFKNDDELHQQKPAEISNIKADIELQEINNKGNIILKINKKVYDLKLVAHGTYNAQNAVAVCGAAVALGVNIDKITADIQEVKSAFGRGELIKIGNKSILLQLVKNPSGFRHALISSSHLYQNLTMIAINDDYADGRDVSWLWDVDFKESGGVSGLVLASGSRAADMALRLKYDGMATDIIEPNLENAVKQAIIILKSGQSAVIYTTYTAMLSLRNILSKLTDVEAI